MDEKLLMNVLKVIKDGKQSELYHIPYEARAKILLFAEKERLIDGIRGTKDGFVGNPQITLEGIKYFEENKTSTKFYRSLKEIRDWIPGY